MVKRRGNARWAPQYRYSRDCGKCNGPAAVALGSTPPPILRTGNEMLSVDN